MVPQRLTLRNFMSYGNDPVTLEFNGFHVLCLSGDNGNGKSALLDAMTYALWGKTRASGTRSGTEDDLVRLGAEDMEIIFDFELEGNCYRVIRRRNRRTRSSTWELQQLHDGAAIPIAGSSARDTEKRLASLLKMEYETFVNSAYIQQGRADEFTRQRPADRKRILSEILNLDRYGQLEELAKDHRRDCDARLADLEGEMRVLEGRVAEEASLRHSLEQHRAALASAHQELDAAEARSAAAEAQLAAFAEKQQRVSQHEAAVRRLQTEKERLQTELASLETDRSRAEAILARTAEIKKQLDELNAARANMERLAGKAEELRQRERESGDLKRKLDRLRADLERDLGTAREQYKKALSAAAEAEKLDAAAREAEAKLNALGDIEKELAASRKTKEELDNDFGTMKAQYEQTTQELREQEEVLRILEQPRAQCPVCETDLTGGRQEAVLQKQRKRYENLKNTLADLKRLGNELKCKREDLARKIQAMEAAARDVHTLRERLQHLREEASKYRREAETAEPLALEIERLHATLENGDYGADIRSALAQLDLQIQALEREVREYNEHAARARQLMAMGVEAQYARIGEAERTVERVSREAQYRRDRLATVEDEISAETQAVDALRQELAGLDAVKREAEAARAVAEQARAGYDRAAKNLGAAQHALAECERARDELAGRQQEHQKLQEERALYHELVSAFGKNGLQALIIENALPEIQDEANRLLGRMTDNGMKVLLRAVRSGQSGKGDIETLDIRIWDDLGERPYEMYSGGEAFRVNFAVRIALSRLLTKRAGAQLQTLILDEGFGSQDAKGRERLVDAIQSVQDEFRLIIVISHIEELKDAFPARVEVVKTPSGSRLEYVA